MKRKDNEWLKTKNKKRKPILNTELRKDAGNRLKEERVKGKGKVSKRELK